MEKYTLEQAWNEVEVLDDVVREIGDAATGLFMEPVEPTHEQKLMIEMDRQTAEHLYNTGQFMEVVVHVGRMYGQSREEALSSRREGTWKDQADWCMTQL